MLNSYLWTKPTTVGRVLLNMSAQRTLAVLERTLLHGVISIWYSRDSCHSLSFYVSEMLTQSALCYFLIQGFFGPGRTPQKKGIHIAQWFSDVFHHAPICLWHPTWGPGGVPHGVKAKSVNKPLKGFRIRRWCSCDDLFFMYVSIYTIGRWE